MMKKLSTPILIFLFLSAIKSFSQPDFCAARHDIGKIGLVRSNFPEFGGSNVVGFPFTDCLTGSEIPIGSCIYPKNSLVTYLDYGHAWIGGIVKSDTLVSSYALWRYFTIPLSGDPSEFHPHEFPYSQMEHRSTLDSASQEFKKARSEQDFIGITTDTVTS